MSLLLVSSGANLSCPLLISLHSLFLPFHPSILLLLSPSLLPSCVVFHFRSRAGYLVPGWHFTLLSVSLVAPKASFKSPAPAPAVFYEILEWTQVTPKIWRPKLKRQRFLPLSSSSSWAGPVGGTHSWPGGGDRRGCAGRAWLLCLCVYLISGLTAWPGWKNRRKRERTGKRVKGEMGVFISCLAGYTTGLKKKGKKDRREARRGKRKMKDRHAETLLRMSKQKCLNDLPAERECRI